MKLNLNINNTDREEQNFRLGDSLGGITLYTLKDNAIVYAGNGNSEEIIDRKKVEFDFHSNANPLRF